MKTTRDAQGWYVCGSCRGPVCAWSGALAGVPDPTILPNYVRLCCLTCRESSEPIAIDDLPIDQRFHLSIQAATRCKCGHVKEAHYFPRGARPLSVDLFGPSPCTLKICGCMEYRSCEPEADATPRPALRIIQGGIK